MWALVPRKAQVLVLAALAIALAWGIEALLSWLRGAAVSPLNLISLVATIISAVVATLVAATWRRVWRRFPWIEQKTFPDLTGTWQGELKSTWIDPATGKPKPPIPTTIWIRQGLFNTIVRLKTGESTSHSTRCLLEPDPEAGRFRVWYSYDNRPRAEVSHRSARHEGVAWLELDIDASPNKLSGCYFTDRRTSGDIEVKRTSREIRG